VLSYLQIGDTP
jgi:MFS family permease